MIERAGRLLQHSRFSFLRASRPSYYGASNVSAFYGFNIRSGGLEITAEIGWDAGAGVSWTCSEKRHRRKTGGMMQLVVLSQPDSFLKRH